MYTKSNILAKLDELLQYSIAQIPTLDYEGKETFDAKYESVVSSGESSVSEYFSADRSQFKKPLDDLSLYLHNELWQRGAKWEGEFDMGFSDDFPESYTDLRKMFYDFSWFMELTNEEFFDAWVYEAPEVAPATEEGGAATPEPSSNSYISRLSSELPTIFDVELKNIDDLGTWLEKSLGQSGSVALWEETGALLEAPKTNDLAKIIFEERGLSEAVETLGLPMYVPTYLRKG